MSGLVLAAGLIALAVLPWTVRRRPWKQAPPPEPVPSVADPALVIALLGAATAAGAPVPRAVRVVGAALGGVLGHQLVRAGARLELGASWDEAWSGAPAGVEIVAAGLRDAWEAGAAPGALLQVAADQHRGRRRAAAREAAGALGSRLVLPLGLCYLPSFVLLGLVPVVLSLAGPMLG
ncbi:MAG: type II secretion system F family protein [Actinobacteria bacterium]|nr:type II secretion system F family protein [Actinomycetota bacterium]MCG2797598.1 type II secretion system F family protein [Cellulomonas sp.]